MRSRLKRERVYAICAGNAYDSTGERRAAPGAALTDLGAEELAADASRPETEEPCSDQFGLYPLLLLQDIHFKGDYPRIRNCVP
jgi:hypothetical protein